MLELRPHQTTSIHSVFQAWRDGYRSVILVAPTGSGKRIMALWLMEYAANAGRKVLFVGNRRLLVTQAQADAEKYEIPFGVIMADNLAGDAGASNQLASIQTLESWHFYDKWSNIPTGTGLPPADLIIIDEIHQDEARYQQLLQFYPNAKILGLTATPVGPQGRSIVPRPYDRLIEGSKNSELIRDGYLLPTVVHAPSEPNIEGVRLTKGEYNQNQLGRAVHSCTVFADVYSEWQKLAEGRATVAFVPGIPFGRDLTRQFNFLLGAGSAHLIEAKTKHHERQEIFQSIQEGRSQIIVSCDVLREGFDLPVLSCGIDLQPNSQLRSYWQKLGRIKRPFGSQTAALWLDFAGNYWRFPHPNEDPEWPEGDQETTQDRIKASRKAGTASQPIMCPKCMVVRERGPTCPGCGHKAEGAIRRIRIGNGKLKEIPAYAKEKVAKSESERLFGQWQSCLFGALKSGRTYSQAARIFESKTGERPRAHWFGVFPPEAVQWKSKPQTTLTMRDLAIACRKSPK